MAEVFGIVAGVVGIAGVAAGFTRKILEIDDDSRHASRDDRELRRELRELEMMLSWFDGARLHQDGGPLEQALKDCNRELKELYDLVRLFQLEAKDSRAARYSKRIRSLSRTIAAIKRIHSQKPNIYPASRSRVDSEEQVRIGLGSVAGFRGLFIERKREQFLDWLCNGYQQDRVQIRDPALETCEWIWRHPQYIAFTSPGSHILQISGKAGCGKSVLAKYVE
ncbi:MAG: hypothetical protein M1840_002377 [Geoglossum simile]|nr:MAG: hypothetical protein M1840_002377 [Geoglossum simile]